MLAHKEDRWALVVKWIAPTGRKQNWILVGKYRYDGKALQDEFCIRTFKTRKEARQYRDQFNNNLYEEFKVVKVSVTVKEIIR